MKRDQIQALFVFLALGVIVAGLMSQRAQGRHAAVVAHNQAFHEIVGEDGWNQAQGMGIGQNQQQGVGQNQPQGMGQQQQPGVYPYAPQYYNPNAAMGTGPAMQQIALAQQGPPITEGQQAPVLIKQMGMEVIEVSGGKVKVTGVMGGSWADKGGLKAGDIILRFKSKPITSLKEFQAMTAAAAPEMDYAVKYLRDGNSKKTMVTIGEGEMEGFLPIKRVPAQDQGTVPVAFGNSMGVALGQGPGAVYRCPQCGNMVSARSAAGGTTRLCKVCNSVMERIR